jgi:hypothetical protein
MKDELHGMIMKPFNASILQSNVAATSVNRHQGSHGLTVDARVRAAVIDSIVISVVVKDNGSLPAGELGAKNVMGSHDFQPVPSVYWNSRLVKMDNSPRLSFADGHNAIVPGFLLRYDGNGGNMGLVNIRWNWNWPSSFASPDGVAPPDWQLYQPVDARLTYNITISGRIYTIR